MLKKLSFHFPSLSTLLNISILSIAVFQTALCCAEETKDAALNDRGIGPVKSVELTSPNADLAAQGKAIFTTKCSACHKVDARYVGPNLGGVTKRRSPEWIMNMMLNPQEMTQKNPIAQDLFGEYLVPMTFQNITEKDARAILEYFRLIDSK